MIGASAIATTSISFTCALAVCSAIAGAPIATLPISAPCYTSESVVTIAEVLTPEIQPPIFVGGGGGGGQFTWRQAHSFQSIKPSKPIVIDTSRTEAEDEEAVIVFVLSELISRGII